MNIPELSLPILYLSVLCLPAPDMRKIANLSECSRDMGLATRDKDACRNNRVKILHRNNLSSSDRLYNCFAMSLMVLGRENWSHQLEMSRNACIKLRSERDACPRDAARCSSLAIPEPPSRKLMTVSSCSMPSIRGSIVAPTRDGSSPSSFTINVLQKLSL